MSTAKFACPEPYPRHQPIPTVFLAVLTSLKSEPKLQSIAIMVHGLVIERLEGGSFAVLSRPEPCGIGWRGKQVELTS